MWICHIFHQLILIRQYRVHVKNIVRKFILLHLFWPFSSCFLDCCSNVECLFWGRWQGQLTISWHLTDWQVMLLTPGKSWTCELVVFSFSFSFTKLTIIVLYCLIMQFWCAWSQALQNWTHQSPQPRGKMAIRQLCQIQITLHSLDYFRKFHKMCVELFMLIFYWLHLHFLILHLPLCSCTTKAMWWR